MINPCLKMLCAATVVATAPVMAQDPSLVAVGVTVGCATMIELESNTTTGYSWQLEELPADSPVKVELAIDKPAKGNLLGAPNCTVVHIYGVHPGETTLKLSYARPWEKDKEPIRTCTILVHVYPAEGGAPWGEL